MKILRWIFGFPLAAVISLGIFFFAIDYGMRGIYISQLYFIEVLYRVVVIVFCFALWVFLTCFFIPSNKRIAGTIPIVASTILLAIIIFVDIKQSHNFNFNRTTAIAFSSFYIGMIIGYFISYIVFKNKGWNRLKKQLQSREFEF